MLAVKSCVGKGYFSRSFFDSPTKLHFCACKISVLDKTTQTPRNLTDFWLWETKHRAFLCLPTEIIDGQAITSTAVKCTPTYTAVYIFLLSVCDVVDLQQCVYVVYNYYQAGIRYQSADRWLIWRLSTYCLPTSVTVYMPNHPTSSVVSSASSGTCSYTTINSTYLLLTSVFTLGVRLVCCSCTYYLSPDMN